MESVAMDATVKEPAWDVHYFTETSTNKYKTFNSYMKIWIISIQWKKQT